MIKTIRLKNMNIWIIQYEDDMHFSKRFGDCMDELNSNSSVTEVLNKFNIPNTKLDNSRLVKQFFKINIK